MLVVKVIFAFLLSALLIKGICGYSVRGNQILDPNGNPIILRGVDRCSFEWNPVGESASLADYTLMKNWGANVVRLPTNQDFWLSGSSTYAPAYQSTIAQQITWIKSLGMGVIIDLHWSDQGNLANSGAQQVMADLNSVTYWTEVATIYKNDPWVLFELYNEPHDVSWSIWLNGGSTNGFTVAGMQQLYNAVRATGANNVVVIGGLNWAFDLSGVAANPVVGTNIAYATHPYEGSGKESTDWPAAFGYLAPTYPIIATEFGQYCDTDNYVQEILAYFASNGISWTAWAWYVNGCSFPSIINDWSGTPLAPAGTLVKAALGTSATVAAATTAKAASTSTTTAKAASTSTTTAKAASTSSTTAKAASTSTTTAKASSSSTSAKASTTGSASGGASATIAVTVNSGTDSYWFAINSPISGTLYTTSTVEIKDSSSGASWQTGTVVSWGWTWATNTPLVAPISILITATNGDTATLTNAVPTVNGGGVYTVTTTYT